MKPKMILKQAPARMAALLILFALLLAACAPAANTPQATGTPPPAENVLPPTETPAAPEETMQPTEIPAAPEDTAQPTENPVPVTGATIQVADNPRLGQILVDASGKTLYTFEIDTPTESMCVERDCVTFWPPLTVTGEPTAAEGVPGELGTITRPDGTMQVTYDGSPLYTFLQDVNPGDTNGDGLDEFGGVWHAVPTSGSPAAGGSEQTPGSSPSPAPTTASDDTGGLYDYDY